MIPFLYKNKIHQQFKKTMTTNNNKNTEPIVITFPAEYRNKCPCCNNEKTIPKKVKYSQCEYNYNEYVKRCEERFGKGAWPICYNCWYNWDMCHACGSTIDRGDIYTMSTSVKDAPGRDHVCTFCSHLTDEQVEEKQESDEKKAIAYEKEHKQKKKDLIKKKISKKSKKHL